MICIGRVFIFIHYYIVYIVTFDLYRSCIYSLSKLMSRRVCLNLPDNILKLNIDMNVSKIRQEPADNVPYSLERLVYRLEWRLLKYRV